MEKLKKSILTIIVSLFVISFSPIAGYAMAVPDIYLEHQIDLETVETAVDMIYDNYIFPINKSEIYNGALHGLYQALDGYSGFYDQEEIVYLLESLENQQLTFGIGLVKDSLGNIYINETLEGSSAREQGIMPKDLIIKMNGIEIWQLDMEEILYIANGRGDSELNLEIERNGKRLYFTLDKREISIPSVNFMKLDENKNISDKKNLSDVGYIKVSTFGSNTSKEFKSALNELKLKDTQRLVLDLRGNTGGYFDEAIEMCKMIVPEGNILFKTKKDGSKTSVKSDLKKKDSFKDIVVIIDSTTASASEIMASALQDSGYKIIGERSYGKLVGQGLYEIADVGYLKLTTEEYLTRNGKKLNNIGITPDIEIKRPEYIAIKNNYATNDIIKIKENLNYYGYNIKNIDGSMDEEFKEIIKKFKKENGLVENDIIDRITIIKINDKLFDTMYTKDLGLEETIKYLNK